MTSLPVTGQFLDDGRSRQLVLLSLGVGGRRGLANHIGQRGAVEAKACGDLPRPVQHHRHLLHQLRDQVAVVFRGIRRASNGLRCR